MTERRPSIPNHDTAHSVIMEMWRSGANTADIADHLAIPEDVIWRTIQRARFPHRNRDRQPA